MRSLRPPCLLCPDRGGGRAGGAGGVDLPSVHPPLGCAAHAAERPQRCALAEKVLVLLSKKSDK
eukprot:1158157-Pelagomonas_calceolata.AAC.12